MANEHIQGQNFELKPNGTIRFFGVQGRVVNDAYWEFTNPKTGESSTFASESYLPDLWAEVLRVRAAGIDKKDIRGLIVTPVYAVMLYLAEYLRPEQLDGANEFNPGRVLFHHVTFYELEVEIRQLIVTPAATSHIAFTGTCGRVLP